MVCIQTWLPFWTYCLSEDSASHPAMNCCLKGLCLLYRIFITLSRCDVLTRLMEHFRLRTSAVLHSLKLAMTGNFCQEGSKTGEYLLYTSLCKDTVMLCSILFLVKVMFRLPSKENNIISFSLSPFSASLRKLCCKVLMSNEP